MIDLAEVRERLRDRRLSVVSRETGIHYNTLIRIRDGANVNPTYRVLEALSAYLSEPRNG